MSQYIAITSACNFFTRAPPRPSLSITSRIPGSNNMALNLPSLPMLSIANHPNYVAAPLESRQCRLKVHASVYHMHGDYADDGCDIDTIFSVAAITCLAFSGILFARLSTNTYLFKSPGVLMLVTGATIAAWTQNRLLKKIKHFKYSEGNLTERIEKLEMATKEQKQKMEEASKEQKEKMEEASKEKKEKMEEGSKEQKHKIVAETVYYYFFDHKN